MKHIKQLLNTNSSKEEIDKLMGQIIETKFDNELKSRYARILAEEYDVHRHESPPQKGNGKGGTVLLAIFIIVLLALAGYLAMQYFKANAGNHQQMAAAYHMDQPFSFNIKSRGMADAERTTLEALGAYEAKDYSLAASKLSTIADPTLEQSFLLGYSHFAETDFGSALTVFSSISPREGDVSYVAEARFYRVLCLLALGREAEALALTDSYAPTSWERRQLDKLLQ